MRTLLTIFLSSLFFTACGDNTPSAVKEGFDQANNPGRFELTTRPLNSLPTSGMLTNDRYPWTGDYWPLWKGGIAQRWQVQRGGRSWFDFQYPLYSRQQLVHGGVALENLSPAEKYDLLLGRYDFPLTASEFAAVRRQAGPWGDVPHWFGLCHGWAPATLLEPEPGHVAVMTNPDGLKIPFFSSDIKALLTKYYADELHGQKGVGQRCNTKDHALYRDFSGRIVQPECRDVNPALLHLALTQLISERNEGFVMDISKGEEVWTQPVTAFRVLSQQPLRFDPYWDRSAMYRAPGTASLVHVRTEVSYVSEMSSSRQPLRAFRDEYTKKLLLEYTLELDQSGVIIGGEWASDNRPDFLLRLNAINLSQENPLLSYRTVREILETSLRQR